MSTVRVVFVQRDGTEVVVANAPVGVSLMETARANGVDGILGECGGGCACATCHVYVEPEWMARLGARDELEEMTLDGVAHILRDNSRLGCQVIVSAAMDGLRVVVAPPQ